MVRRPTRLGGGACALTHVAIAMDTVAASATARAAAAVAAFAAARWMRRRAAAIALGQACFESAAVSMLRRPPPRPSTAGFAALVDALTTDPARSSDSGSESVPPPAAVSVHDAPRPAASRTRQLTLGSGSGEDEFTESVCGPRCSKQRGVGSPNDGAAKFTSPDNICWRKKSSKEGGGSGSLQISGGSCGCGRRARAVRGRLGTTTACSRLAETSGSGASQNVQAR